MKLGQLIFQAEVELEANHKPKSIAKKMAIYLLGISASELLSRLNEKINEKILKKYRKNIKKIINNVPFEYLTGKYFYQEFILKIDKNTLIPRDETIELIEMIKPLLKPNHEVLDLCAGSGIIGISLSRITNLPIYFSEINPLTIKTLKENVATNKVDGKVLTSDLFSNINHKFDVIVTNPPYIDPSDKDIQSSVIEHEPKQALFSDNNGLSCIEKIIKTFQNHVKPNYLFAMEFGHNQKSAITNLLINQGILNFEFKKDINGKERFLLINEFKYS